MKAERNKRQRKEKLNEGGRKRKKEERKGKEEK